MCIIYVSFESIIFHLSLVAKKALKKNTQTWLPREIAHSICQALFPRPRGVLLTNVDEDLIRSVWARTP